jgi:hypothetical protein
VDRTLYGALQVLDGVTPPIGNEDLDVEFVLTARVSDRVTGQVIDEIELGQNGEGLCMGFHGWVEGDFGSVPVSGWRSSPLRTRAQTRDLIYDKDGELAGSPLDP